MRKIYVVRCEECGGDEWIDLNAYASKEKAKERIEQLCKIEPELYYDIIELCYYD